jgi:hypothetical protein
MSAQNAIRIFFHEHFVVGILVGTFNKLLFPSLGLGFVVLPPALVDPFLALRYGADLCTVGFNQAILCDFMIEGHMDWQSARGLWQNSMGVLTTIMRCQAAAAPENSGTSLRR